MNRFSKKCGIKCQIKKIRSFPEKGNEKHILTPIYDWKIDLLICLRNAYYLVDSRLARWENIAKISPLRGS